MGALLLAQSDNVSDEQADRVTERREQLGLTKSKLAALAGVDRETLAKIEDGQTVMPAKLAQVLAALDRREHEYGMDTTAAPTEEPTVEQISFTVAGDFGVTVTVKGPIGDRLELEASVANIIRSIRENSPRSD